MRSSGGAALSCRRGFWEHAVPSSAERKGKAGGRCLYFGLFGPGIGLLLMLQHERYSRSEGISCRRIYFFRTFFDTLAPLDSARWSNTEKRSRRGLPHMCGSVQRSQTISAALWDIWPADPRNNPSGTLLSCSLTPFISVLMRFFPIFMNSSCVCAVDARSGDRFEAFINAWHQIVQDGLPCLALTQLLKALSKVFLKWMRNERVRRWCLLCQLLVFPPSFPGTIVFSRSPWAAGLQIWQQKPLRCQQQTAAQSDSSLLEQNERLVPEPLQMLRHYGLQLPTQLQQTV